MASSGGDELCSGVMSCSVSSFVSSTESATDGSGLGGDGDDLNSPWGGITGQLC